jgi:hypothetical protein
VRDWYSDTGLERPPVLMHPRLTEGEATAGVQGVERPVIFREDVTRTPQFSASTHTSGKWPTRFISIGCGDVREMINS